jgi:peptide/nickel transport system permease protein
MTRRVLWMLVGLWGVSLITFAMLYLIPRDPARAIGGPEASAQALANIRHHLGLDQPLYVRYGL